MNDIELFHLTSVSAYETHRCRHKKTGHYIATFRDSCYMFVNEEKHWVEARAFCWRAGAEMVVVPDHNTMEFLKFVLDSKELGWDNNGVWNGASDLRNRGWEWTTGKDFFTCLKYPSFLL